MFSLHWELFQWTEILSLYRKKDEEYEISKMEQQIFVENLQVHLKKQLRSKMRVLSGVIPFSMIIQENFPRSTMFGKDIRDLYNYEVNISKESLPYFTKNRRKK